jgi:hypothetical protein
LLNGEISGFDAIKNFVHVERSPPEHVRNADRVGDEAS